MSDSDPANTGTAPGPGVTNPTLARVVRLGESTVMIIDLGDEAVAEGDYVLKSIETVINLPGGAMDCGTRCTTRCGTDVP